MSSSDKVLGSPDDGTMKSHPLQPEVQHVQPGVQPPQQQSIQHVTIIQQPTSTVPTKRPWSSNICGCFQDCTSCILTWFFPTCFACCLATRMKENCCVPGCVGIVPMRTKLRTENNIQGSICEDWFMVNCCYVCVICQLSREMDHVGTY